MWYVFMLIVFWLIVWPGPMFWVGLILESRTLPIGKQQSRAFIPGDFFLGVMCLALIGLYRGGFAPDTDVKFAHSVITTIVIFVLVDTFFYFWRKRDIADYKKYFGEQKAMKNGKKVVMWKCTVHSPAKVLHDVVGFGFFPAAIIRMGIPVLFKWSTKAGKLHFGGPVLNWGSLIFWLALAAYLICACTDKQASVEDMYARHPWNWHPIWKRRRINGYRFWDED